MSRSKKCELCGGMGEYLTSYAHVEGGRIVDEELRPCPLCSKKIHKTPEEQGDEDYQLSVDNQLTYEVSK